MIDLQDFVQKIDVKGRKTKRYKSYCNSCGDSRGYDMLSRADRLCRKCARVNDKLEKCAAAAKANGGSLLSSEWKGSTHKYNWQCGTCNHIWNAYSYVVLRGSWCPRCGVRSMASKNRIKGVEYCSELAASLGGKFLSEEYSNDSSHYRWQCSSGHEWSTRLTVIEGGSWCPTCFNENDRLRRRESEMRNILEKTFGTSFPSSRPDWLINPETGYSMELDCYNHKLGVAFEYDGELHYKDVDFFGNSKDKQRQRDIIKNELCKKNGVKLFRISYKDKNKLEERILELIDGLF